MPCGTSAFGSVTLEDGVGLNAGKFFVTVDLQGFAGKFRDLMLNFNGGGITAVSSADGQAHLSPNGFWLSPYNGLFDIGRSDQQGWSSTSALYTTLLTGSGGSLTVGMFDVKDSLGKLNVALHLQELTQHIGCDDSLKVGGVWEKGGEVPEPATAALMGGGLIVLAWTVRRRKASHSGPSNS